MHKPSSSLARVSLRGLAVFACLTCASAYAAKFKVTVTNLAPNDGLWFTPVFFGFHDGSFDLFDSGSPASSSPGIQAIAEGGDVSGVASRFGSDANAGAKSHVLLGQDSAMGPPAALFAPTNFNPAFSSTNSFMTTLSPTANAFLTFASMIVPSNDAFIGNDDPEAYSLFNMDGTFKKGFQINVFGANIWDAGTEANTGFDAAFSTLMGPRTGEMELIGQHSGLHNFVGTALPVGPDLEHAFSSDTPVARITVEQVPDSTQYVGFMGIIALIGFRFVSKKRADKARS